MEQFKWTLILMFLYANTVVCHAQTDFPEPQEYVLQNGLKVLYVEDQQRSTVSFLLKIEIVPVHERELAGVSELMGNLLLSGTNTNSKADIDQVIEFLGAQIQTTSDGFYASCPAQNAKEFLSILLQIVSESNFPIQEFDKVKAQMASSLVGSENDPEVISRRVGNVVRFKKGLPYGELVTEKSINNIQRRNVQVYYDQFYIPENAYLVVVGDLPVAEMIKTIRSTFSLWGPTTSDTTSADEQIMSLTNISEIKKYPQPPKQNHVVFVDVPGTQECMIDITYPIFLSPNDPNALSADLMNGILNRRLLEVFPDGILQNDSIDHSVTALQADEYIGSFSAKVKVQNAFADSAVNIILNEMERMIKGTVGKKEIKFVKETLTNKFTSSLEDPRVVSDLILERVLFDLQKDHYGTYLKRLDTISSGTIQAMASAFLKPSNAHIIVVGNKEEIANKHSKFADRSGIEYLDKNGDRYREKLQMPPTGITAQQVINDHYTALGGKSKLLARNAEKIVMTTEIDGSRVEITSYRKAPNKYLMTFTVDDRERSKKVYNGSKGVLIQEGRTMEPVDIDLAELSYEADMNFGIKYQQLSFDLSFVGISNVKGRPANKVRIITESGIPIEEYFDVETKLMVKRIEIKYTSQGQMKKVTYFEDHKEVDGILYPHTVTELFDKKRIYEVKSITLNEEMNDDLFLIP